MDIIDKDGMNALYSDKYVTLNEQKKEVSNKLKEIVINNIHTLSKINLNYNECIIKDHIMNLQEYKIWVDIYKKYNRTELTQSRVAKLFNRSSYNDINPTFGKIECHIEKENIENAYFIVKIKDHNKYRLVQASKLTTDDVYNISFEDNSYATSLIRDLDISSSDKSINNVDNKIENYLKDLKTYDEDDDKDEHILNCDNNVNDNIITKLDKSLKYIILQMRNINMSEYKTKQIISGFEIKLNIKKQPKENKNE